MQNENKLDNPAWYSLSESHQQFSVNYSGIKFYHPDYCPFGGFKTSASIVKPIDAYSKMAANFFVIGSKPQHSNKVMLQKELICLQMTITSRIDTSIKANITPLNNGHEAALFNLVNLVQPGYFKSKTTLLGNYFGIFNDEGLIAAAGERMRMNDFVEVSAIVTHPEYTGQGYAKQLIAHTVNNIFVQNKIPYLHVAESNTGAIQLYQKLGFITRRKISFWNIAAI